MKMKNIKKLCILILMSAVVSLSLGGCAKKSEKSESPAKEQTTNEHPEHPTDKKTSSEHPEHPTDNKSSSEHPSDDK
jgi:ABC-type oligopeptide transport system substrate-binding subunit